MNFKSGHSFIDVVYFWLGGNLLEVENLELADVTCTVCGEECSDNEISVSQCCWCQKVKHSTCILSISANVSLKNLLFLFLIDKAVIHEYTFF